MRKDMDRILVGRPRLGGNLPKKTGHGRKPRDVEELPTKESMKDRWNVSNNRKYLNENLAPFMRFLEKQVGRPWNKVYSEIRKRINAKSAVQAHILQHLWDFVERHAKLDDKGVPRVYHGWSPGSEVDGLYVCPKTGMLKKNQVKKKRWTKPKPKYTEIEGKKYIETDHGWFEIEVESVSRRWIRNPTKEFGRNYSILAPDTHLDALHKKWMTIQELRDFYGTDVVCAGKRPLNKKQIRQLGLKR